MENKKHYTFSGYDSNMNPTYRVKKGYNCEVDAVLRCYQLNLSPQSIHKAVAYKCPTCGRWHIGHNNVTLTNDIREKISIKFEHFKRIHGIKS